MTTPPLTRDELAILDFERDWWRHAGAKGTAITEHLAIPPAEYYRTLTRLLDDPRAADYDRMLVRRLRRMRNMGRIPDGMVAPAERPSIDAVRDDPDVMRAMLEEHGSDAAVGRAIGAGTTTIRRWRVDLGVDAVQPGGQRWR